MSTLASLSGLALVRDTLYWIGKSNSTRQ